MDKKEFIHAVASRHDNLAHAHVAHIVDCIFAALGGGIETGRTVKATEFGRSRQ